MAYLGWAQRGPGQASLTSAQVEEIVTDLALGENLGFINPAGSTLVSRNAADYFYNVADDNALYRATAAGQPVSQFSRVSLPSGAVQMTTSDW